jgi:hypothetical protein
MTSMSQSKLLVATLATGKKKETPGVDGLSLNSHEKLGHKFI